MADNLRTCMDSIKLGAVQLSQELLCQSSGTADLGHTGLCFYLVRDFTAWPMISSVKAVLVRVFTNSK